MLKAICDRCNGDISLFGGYLSGASGQSLGPYVSYSPDLLCMECAPSDVAKRQQARSDAIVWWITTGLWKRGLT